MISLIIPPKDQIPRISKMLADEYGTASNIKSRVNRLSVLGAITSVQHRLKLYTKVPPNGLVIYCGTIVTEEGKEKKVNIDFEPFKPINTSLYLCDNKFHTEALSALLADDNKFGFIVMDGNGALFGTLQGNTRDVMHKFTVDLPKKHGQSAGAQRCRPRYLRRQMPLTWTSTAPPCSSYSMRSLTHPLTHPPTRPLTHPPERRRQRRSVGAAIRASAHGEAA